jgi:hypothetical protein
MSFEKKISSDPNKEQEIEKRRKEKFPSTPKFLLPGTVYSLPINEVNVKK